MRIVFRWWAAIVFAAVLVQIAFAGYAAFYVVDKVDDPPKTLTSDQVEHGFNPHSAFGYLVILLGIVLVPLAFGARVDRMRKKLSVVIAVLLVIQFFLAVLGWSWAPLGFLHPLNALAIAAVTGMLARIEWRSGPTAATATATPGETVGGD
jgi:ammonia channel protein AmtB